MEHFGNTPGEKPDHCPVCDGAVAALPGGDTPCPRCGHLLWFGSRQVGDVTVIHLDDTRSAVMELLDFLDRALQDGLIGRVLINFENIQQVSSAALGKLVKLIKRAGNVRGKLRLCDLHPDLRQVFRITQLDRVFEIHDSESEALAAFAPELALP